MGVEFYKNSEEEVVRSTRNPNTITTLKREFKTLGIKQGLVILMHGSLSKIGWTVGGSVAVIKALMDILTSEGTLVMPSFSSDNTDPSLWENPPVPRNWWEIIRREMPAYHPDITPTRRIGIIAETFRKWPCVVRSNHPTSSFAAWGKYADYITKNHEIEIDLGENSPLARIYELDGKILLVGVTHKNNSSLHLAEYRSNYPNKRFRSNGSAILMNNLRQWKEWTELDLNPEDFEQLGRDFESKINYSPRKIGLADARLLSQRRLVDFAVSWFKSNRIAK